MIIQRFCNQCKKLIMEYEKILTVEETRKMFFRKHYCLECQKKHEEKRMSYSKNHNDDQCDSCLKEVGLENLVKLPFTYTDMNDDQHEDLGHGKRQYWVCKKCREEIKE